MKNISQGLRFKELKNKFTQLKPRERVVLALGILAGMFFFFVRYGLIPNVKVISGRRSDIQLKSEDIEIARAEGANLGELQEEYRKLLEKIQNFEAKIPSETKADVFVNDLTELARKHGVNIKSIKSSNIEKEGEYMRFTTQIDLVSAPQNLISFLDALATIPRLVGIKEFEIKAERQSPPDVHATVVVATYSIA